MKGKVAASLKNRMAASDIALVNGLSTDERTQCEWRREEENTGKEIQEEINGY
jgi:hypothetical protein